MLSVWVLTESIQSIVFLYTQSQKVERLQSEMKTQEQQMEDIDGAKQKITVSALSLNSHTYLLYFAPPCLKISCTGVCVCVHTCMYVSLLQFESKFTIIPASKFPDFTTSSYHNIIFLASYQHYIYSQCTYYWALLFLYRS